MAKTKLFICTGCDIAKSLDIEKLKSVAGSDLGITDPMVHPFLCGPEGVASVKSVLTEGADKPKLALAACGFRSKHAEFDFGQEVMVERIDIRDLAVWTQPAMTEDTQMLAEDYLRMGVAKLEAVEQPAKLTAAISKHVAVIGAGPAGISAALAAASAGNDVTLIEKSAQPGGYMKNLAHRFPRDGADSPDKVDLEGLVSRLKSNVKITPVYNAVVTSTEGQPGNFKLKLGSADSSAQAGDIPAEVEAGAIVLAAGSRPYDPVKLDKYGYGKIKNVITSHEFEAMLKSGNIVRPSDSTAPKSVIFIQCAGSRDEKHLPYCSSVCCMTSLKQAVLFRASSPDARVYILYRDIRTPGLQESFYKKVQEDDGIFFAKGDYHSAEHTDTDAVRVYFSGTMFGSMAGFEADLVVLATGLVPVSGEKLLGLEYRQGPELPELADGFPDSHFICFPYETRRTGIYTAGTIRTPMDSAEAETDGIGAAMKAVQSIALAEQGRAVHPRSGDLTIPEFALDRCTQCKRCTEDCPFGAINEDDKGTPEIFPFRCRRCGTCMGACPVRIISFKDYGIDIIDRMIKGVVVPPEEDNKPRILVFACENDALPAVSAAASERLALNPHARFIRIRCAGSFNLVWVANALSSGIDGVLILGCKSGDDYQCHNIRGSELAQERLGKVQETLDRLALEAGRVQFAAVDISDGRRLQTVLDNFAKEIDSFGPNPYKGF